MLANPSYLRYDRPGRRPSGRKTCAFGHTDWSARTRSVKSSSVAGRSFSLYRATSAPSQTNNHPECVAFNEHPDRRWPRIDMWGLLSRVKVFGLIQNGMKNLGPLLFLFSLIVPWRVPNRSTTGGCHCAIRVNHWFHDDSCYQPHG
jgi:hypothetical protein